jgi:proline dehydrogenase
MEYLLEQGHYPAIATHDSAIIKHACAFSRREGIDPDRFEFQMLYGVRRDLQEALVHRGYTVRVYVPYGTQWYPYLTRRLAERPANLLSFAGSVVRERERSSSTASPSS